MFLLSIAYYNQAVYPNYVQKLQGLFSIHNKSKTMIQYNPNKSHLLVGNGKTNYFGKSLMYLITFSLEGTTVS